MYLAAILCIEKLRPIKLIDTASPISPKRPRIFRTISLIKSWDGIPFFRLIFYADTFFVHPFFFAERSKQTQFHPFFFAERSKQTHFHPFFKADMTVEPSKMGHIDLLWDLAMKEQKGQSNGEVKGRFIQL